MPYKVMIVLPTTQLIIIIIIIFIFLNRKVLHKRKVLQAHAELVIAVEFNQNVLPKMYNFKIN